MSFYEDIVQGLNEAIEYKKGNVKLKTSDVTIAPLPEIKSEDVKNIRMTLDMTQGIFAAVMGVSPKTVEAWEAGTNTPSGSAKRMLSLLQSDPDLLKKHNIYSC